MDEIQKRLARAMQQLQREMAVTGGMPDCEMIVRVNGGEITVMPSPVQPSPLTPLPQGEGDEGKGLLRGEVEEPAISPKWEAALTGLKKASRKKKGE